MLFAYLVICYLPILVFGSGLSLALLLIGLVGSIELLFNYRTDSITHGYPGCFPRYWKCKIALEMYRYLFQVASGFLFSFFSLRGWAEGRRNGCWTWVYPINLIFFMDVSQLLIDQANLHLFFEWEMNWHRVLHHPEQDSKWEKQPTAWNSNV